MSAVYCDTSVIIPYYTPETYSVQAELALQAQGQRLLSSLVLTEASAALRRKVHDHELSRADAQLALDAFRQDVVTGMFGVIDVERRHFDHAAVQVWSIKERLRTLDALHLAVAELDGLPVVTADVGMAAAAKKIGIRVIWAGG